VNAAERLLPYNQLDYETQLAALYAKQANIAADGYLHAHSRNRAVICRQVGIFHRCARFLVGAQHVLDWGCRHAADACLARMLLGNAVHLHGCDVDPPSYQAFFEFAALHYTRLTHPWKLPYDDNRFDVVIGSGVLEHVPNDSESLKELYRVIRPGGYFIMTMLPNRRSYTEWMNRRLGNPHHLRLYSLQEAVHAFMHHGFLPEMKGYHQLIPSLSSGRRGIFDAPAANWLVERLVGLNEPLERVPLLRTIATNIFIVGRKVEAFHG
jgi:SAM-dependent methyltransferase